MNFPEIQSRKKLLDKHLVHSVKNIPGVGISTSRWVLASLGLQNRFKSATCNFEKEQIIVKHLTNLPIPVGVRFRDYTFLQKKLLKKEGTYRSRRILQCLPVRGQRTRSNARTQKAKKPSSQKFTRTAFNRKSFKSKKRKTSFRNKNIEVLKNHSDGFRSISRTL